MDTRDMSIMTLDEMKQKLQQKPQAAKFFKEIPVEMADAMKGMNRAQRRAYWKAHKRGIK